MTLLSEAVIERPENAEELIAGGISGETGAIITGALVAHVYPNNLGRVFIAQSDFTLEGIGKRQPSRKIVEVYSQGNPFPTPLRPDEELVGGDVLPGFKLKVSNLFRD